MHVRSAVAILLLLSVVLLLSVAAYVSGCMDEPAGPVGVWRGVEDGSLLWVDEDGTWTHGTIGGTDTGTYAEDGPDGLRLESDLVDGAGADVILRVIGSDSARVVVRGEESTREVTFEYARRGDEVRPEPSPDPVSRRFSMRLTDSGRIEPDDVLAPLHVRSWALGFAVERLEPSEGVASVTLRAAATEDGWRRVVSALGRRGRVSVASVEATGLVRETSAPEEAIGEEVVLSGHVREALLPAEDAEPPVVELLLDAVTADRLSALARGRVRGTGTLLADGVVVAPSVRVPGSGRTFSFGEGVEPDELALLTILMKSGPLPSDPRVIPIDEAHYRTFALPAIAVAAEATERGAALERLAWYRVGESREDGAFPTDGLVPVRITAVDAATEDEERRITVDRIELVTGAGDSTLASVEASDQASDEASEGIPEVFFVRDEVDESVELAVEDGTQVVLYAAVVGVAEGDTVIDVGGPPMVMLDLAELMRRYQEPGGAIPASMREAGAVIALSEGAVAAIVGNYPDED